MTTTELLAYLRGRGVELWADGDRLRYRAPTGMLTPALRAELAARKQEILALLRQAKASASGTAPSLQAISHDGELPLSFAQERIWFLHQLEPYNPVYNIPLAVRITGPLKVVALEQSLNEIVRRHKVLRTTCSTVSGQPVQVIAPELTLTLPVLDLRELRQDEREAEVQRLATEEARQPFDLAQGPLFRVTLLWLSEEEYVLLLTTHHFLADGWSMEVLYREISALYEALAAGKPSPLPQLPIQYADFAHWQRHWLQGEVLQGLLSYWKKQVDSAPDVLELPFDRPRPPVQTHRGATLSFKLPAVLSEAIRELSRREGVTLFMTLLAAFQTLLHRYTHQDDVIVGTAVSTRNRVEIEGLIGPFANSLVIRTNLSGNPTFRELLARVFETAIGAFAHQDLPFEKLLEELQLERHLSHNPLFQVMFVLHQHTLEQNLRLPNLTLSRLPIEMGTARVDLSLAMTDVEGELSGSLEYNTDLFDTATVEWMLEHFQTLLEGIVADPEERIGALPLLTEAERHQLLVEWNDTQTDYPKDCCIHQLFEAQVERTPDAVAVVFGDQQLTYRQLNARANQLAHYLRKRGVGPEVLVGICVERSLEMVVGLLGILKAGGAYVPLDPAYPKERLAFMLEDTQTSVLLTQERLLEAVPEHGAEVVCLDVDWETIARESKENLSGNTTTDNLAYVIYTSGSTGQPKGVMIEHRSLTNYLYWVNESLLDDTVHSLPMVTRLTFDASLKQLFAPLQLGGEVWVLPDNVATQPAVLLQVLNTRAKVGLNCVPSLWKAMLDAIDSNQAITPTESLTHLFFGGERLSKELVHRSFTMLPHLQIWNLYGPTETTANATAARMVSEDDVTIGHPISNTQVYLLDRYLNPIPIGVPGELHIGGVGLARGYLNRPELTAERFIPNPFSDEPGARLYKTGDLARYLPDGNIEFLGRLDYQVKIRGFRIELGEIEAMLGQHPTVRESVVVAWEDGLGRKRLVAYLVANQRPAPSSSELRRFLQEKLPTYMVPSAFVTLDALPLTPNGKVDRRALPAPDRVRPDLQEVFVAPRTPVEEVLAGIWSEVLGLERIGVYDNFFELGGHSLLATQVISRLRNAFQVELPLRCIFEAPTVAELSTAIEKAKDSSAEFRASIIVPVSRKAHRKDPQEEC